MREIVAETHRQSWPGFTISFLMAREWYQRIPPPGLPADMEEAAIPATVARNHVFGKLIDHPDPDVRAALQKRCAADFRALADDLMDDDASR